jgi:hypothetical protein
VARDTSIRAKLEYSIGLCHEKMEDSQASIQHFSNSYDLSPTNLAIYHLGVNQFKAGRLR